MFFFLENYVMCNSNWIIYKNQATVKTVKWNFESELLIRQGEQKFLKLVEALRIQNQLCILKSKKDMLLFCWHPCISILPVCVLECVSPCPGIASLRGHLYKWRFVSFYSIFILLIKLSIYRFRWKHASGFYTRVLRPEPIGRPETRVIALFSKVETNHV